MIKLWIQARDYLLSRSRANLDVDHSATGRTMFGFLSLGDREPAQTSVVVQKPHRTLRLHCVKSQKILCCADRIILQHSLTGKSIPAVRSKKLDAESAVVPFLQHLPYMPSSFLASLPRGTIGLLENSWSDRTRRMIMKSADTGLWQIPNELGKRSKRAALGHCITVRRCQALRPPPIFEYTAGPFWDLTVQDTNGDAVYASSLMLMCSLWMWIPAAG
jgi:hypothetical protein